MVEGKPLVLYTLELACSLPFKTVHLIAADAKVIELGRRFPVQIQQNLNPQRGQCESVRLGTLNSKAEYYMFFTCDQPFMTAEIVLAVCEKAAPEKIVFPTHNEQHAAPNLFSRTFRDELLNLKDGENARVIKNRHPDALVPVPVSDARMLVDIDTKEDLLRLGE